MTAELNTDPRATLAVSRILGAALAGGVLVFLLLAIGLTSSGAFTPPMPPPAPGPAGGISPILGMHPTVATISLVGISLAVFAAPVGLIIRAKIMAAGRDPETGAVAPSSFATAHLVAHALFESFGLIGGILILLSGQLIPGLPLALLSILFIAASFPSPRALTPNPYADVPETSAYSREP